jgi:hypothetical protein
LAGFIPVVGGVAGVIDEFVVDHLAERKSPRFFVNDLRAFQPSRASSLKEAGSPD